MNHNFLIQLLKIIKQSKQPILTIKVLKDDVI